MGFRDATWAQDLELPLADKAVLIVLALATDDTKHETFAGQETLATRSGASVKTVSRALANLEHAGIIRRSRRFGKGGYRTSDLIVLNTSYRTESLEGSQPSGLTALQADSPDLPDSLSTPTGLSDGAKEIIQLDHPEDHSELSLKRADRARSKTHGPTANHSFDDFWKIWPRKVAKRAASRAWDAAVKRADPQVILTAARAYASSPKLPKGEFIPYPATWLNGDRWEDESATTGGNYQVAVESRCAREGHDRLPDTHYCRRCGVDLDEEVA